MTNPTKTLFTKVCNSSLSVFESVVRGFEKREGYKKRLKSLMIRSECRNKFLSTNLMKKKKIKEEYRKYGSNS